MNWRRAVLAGLAGGAAYYLIKIALDRLSIKAFGYPYNTYVPLPSPLQVFIFAPTVVSLIGALPLRLIGVGWRRSLFAAWVAYANAAAAWHLMLPLTYGWFSILGVSQNLVLAFVVGAGATVLVAIFGRKETKPFAPFVTVGITLVLIIVVFQPGTVTFRPYKYMGLLACILLPAVAALMQYRPDEVEDEGSGTYRWDEGEVPAYAHDQPTSRRVQPEPRGPKT